MPLTLEQVCEIARARVPTAEELVGFARGQGWEVVARGDGRLALRVPDAGDPLARALARLLGREPYRTRVLRLVTGGPPPREWLWRDGHRATEEAWWGWPEGHHPAGAWWWRRQGEGEWRVIPGRPAEGDPPRSGPTRSGS